MPWGKREVEIEGEAKTNGNCDTRRAYCKSCYQPAGTVSQKALQVSTSLGELFQALLTNMNQLGSPQEEY